MCNKEYVMSLLDWNNTEELQNKGVQLAIEMNQISCFIQPMDPQYNKNVWGNCAKIVSVKTDEELKPFMVSLFEWLQDMNWPGAEIIYDRLIHIEAKLILNDFLYCLRTAIQTEDGTWIYSLKNFAIEKGLIDMLPTTEKLYLEGVHNRN